MTTIRLAERTSNPDGSFGVRVEYPDGIEYDVTVTDPADADTEALLAWYFEQHLRFPFLDADRRGAAVTALREYGETLFAQVLAGEPGERYRDHRATGFDGCRIEITGTAGLHRLHWEALRDPALDTPLALRLPITRRVDRQPLKFQLPDPHPTLNILLVTARPDGPRDVGYRTISRPLLDALRQAALPVTVDLVRPGTWQALRDHLRDTTRRHGSGWYHLVHFDVHGLFADYDTLHNGQQAGSLLFTPDQLPRFEGKQGFLFFETARDGQPQPCSAGQVAALLAEHRVPMAVLNACQSAMQTASEAALAQQLVQAGIPVVVGMAYSVTVTAATLAMPRLYRLLAQQVEPDQALRAMRETLSDDPQRDAYFNQRLPLADWVLPVVFRQQPLRLSVRPMDEHESERFYARQDAVGEEPTTEYGFVGRDLDIQAVERRLLLAPDRNQLLVQGMAGAGKSTLLAHLGWWWQRTGLVERVLAFNYDQRAWTVGQMVREIAADLWGRVEFARWEGLTESARRERVAEALRATRHLLVIDNAESITASPAAIPHALDEAERDGLRRWVSRLRGGRTLVVWGSREPERWAARDSFGDNVHQLSGLDPQAASVLADRILQRHGATRHRNDADEHEALTELLTLLGGYPLPLEVVLPTLATTAPRAVLAELTTGGAGADPVGLIRSAIEYSHGKLDPAVQNSLLLLAPFTVTIPPLLELYQEFLAVREPADDPWGTVDLAAGLRAAVDIGLAAPSDELQDWVQLVPVLPYFLRQRLRDHPAWWTATRWAHYEAYAAIGQLLCEMLDSSEPNDQETARAIVQISYANITATLAFAIEQRQRVMPVLMPLNMFLDQTHQHTARRLVLRQAVDGLADRDDELARLERARLLRTAGDAAVNERHLAEALMCYQESLQLNLELGDRHAAGIVYGELGRVAQEQRRFDQAEKYYRQSIDVLREFNDRHGVASTYHNLGCIAYEQDRLDKAKSLYQQALDIRLEVGDRHNTAVTYHNLGGVALEQGRLDEADRCYQEALRIKQEFNDRHAAAVTYVSLGVVAEQRGWLDEADRYLRQALALHIEFQDTYGIAATYANLGGVAKAQDRRDEAKSLYQQALEIYLEFDDRHDAMEIHQILFNVASDEGRYDDMERHLQQALAIALEIGDQQATAESQRVLAELNRLRTSDDGPSGPAEQGGAQAAEEHAEHERDGE